MPICPPPGPDLIAPVGAGQAAHERVGRAPTGSLASRRIRAPHRARAQTSSPTTTRFRSGACVRPRCATATTRPRSGTLPTSRRSWKARVGLSESREARRDRRAGRARHDALHPYGPARGFSSCSSPASWLRARAGGP